MAQHERTEQPTEQKLRKARKEGRFPVSRELVFGVQFGVFAALALAGTPAFLADLARMMRITLGAAMESNAADWRPAFASAAAPVLWGCGAAGLLMVAGGGLAHGVMTGFGLAAARLKPELSRISPASRLRELPGQNFTAFCQGALLLPLLGLALWMVVAEHGEALVRLPRLAVESGMAIAAGSVAGLLKRAVALFAIWGAFDAWRQHRRWRQGLRMTKQEIREESKESEGSPEIKQRIRRLRRELLRRRMMSEVPKATAVLVNPTHYAVALRYHAGMTAPKVVAKGKNWLALRIREIARHHQVPVIENPPLAQALYASAEAGQEIPAHLYRAVAEILAYLFRILGGRLPGG
jgi:flagellar biosynthetic protein FlhB